MNENPAARQAELDQRWRELEEKTNLDDAFLLVRQMTACEEFGWSLSLRGPLLKLAKMFVDVASMEMVHRIEVRNAGNSRET